jgi:SAM-dependent methyltransferase
VTYFSATLLCAFLAADLGSGTGKPCIAAALLWPFRKVVGVELLPSLHALATQAAARLALGNGESSLAGDGPGESMETSGAATSAAQAQPDVMFQCGDLFALDVGDADIVFVASTGFDEATFERLARHLRQSVRIGTVIVSLSLPVPVQASVAASKVAVDADFKTVLEKRFRFSWGNCSVYFSTFGA